MVDRPETGRCASVSPTAWPAIGRLESPSIQVWNYAAMQDGKSRDMTELVKYVESWSDGKGIAR
jgi:hypothetical protein